MPVGAIARTTLSGQSTGATARNTGCAGARDADIRAAVAVAHASAPACGTATAVKTCVAGGAADTGAARLVALLT